MKKAKKEIRVQTLFDIPLFTWADNGTDQDIDPRWYDVIEWCFDSMKKFNGCRICLWKFDELGNITILDKSGKKVEKNWSNVSLLQIPEFKDALLVKLATYHQAK